MATWMVSTGKHQDYVQITTFIWIDIGQAIQGDIPFYLCANGCVLSPGNANGSIPSEYFLKVVTGKLGPSA